MAAKPVYRIIESLDDDDYSIVDYILSNSDEAFQLCIALAQRTHSTAAEWQHTIIDAVSKYFGLNGINEE